MDYAVLLLGFFVCFALLVRRDLVLGFAVMAALLPAYVLRFSLGPIPSTVLEGMSVMILIGVAYKLGHSKQSWFQASNTMLATPYFKPGILLLVAGLAACFVGDDLRASLGIWRAYFLEPLLIYVAARLILTTEEDWSMVHKGLGVAVLGLTGLALYQYFTGSYLPTWEWTVTETRRATGVYTSPNSLGLFVAPVAMLFLARILSVGKAFSWRTHGFDALIVLAAIIAILLAWSKGAMIAFVIGTAYLAYRLISKKYTLIALATCAALILIIPVTRTKAIELVRFQSASGQSRLALYQGSLDLIKQNPITGTGLAQFGKAFESVRPDTFTEKLIYPHNIFLNFWLETGLLGLIAVVWIMGIASRRATQNKESIVILGVSAALLTMLIHGLVDVPYFKNDLAMLVWLLLSRDILPLYAKESRLPSRS